MDSDNNIRTTRIRYLDYLMDSDNKNTDGFGQQGWDYLMDSNNKDSENYLMDSDNKDKTI